MAQEVEQKLGLGNVLQRPLPLAGEVGEARSGLGRVSRADGAWDARTVPGVECPVARCRYLRSGELADGNCPAGTPSRAAEAERGRGMRLDERDHRSLVLWATECAGHVLPFFEEKYPEDDRPRDAVEAGRAWARGEIAMSEARAAAFAAHAAASDADEAAAHACARAAGHAAATAHVAGHAAHAANYALTAATAAPTDSAAAAAEEHDRQYRRLPKRLRPVAFPARSNN